MKKKTIALMLVMMMVFGITVGGTIAYLQDSKSVKNTFTVGNVKIALDEALVDLYGVPQKNIGTEEKPVYEAAQFEDADRVTANTYKLIPGHTYTKDPTVTVDAASEDAYLRMIVTLTFENELNDEEVATKIEEIFPTYDAAKWTLTKTYGADKKTVTFEFRYTEVVKANNTVVLFKEFTVPSDMDVAALGGFVMDVEAHAIQKDGFTDVDNAFDTGWGK